MIFWLSILYIVLSLLHIADWTMRHVIIPYFMRKKSLRWLDTPTKKLAYSHFQSLYANSRAKTMAKHEVRRLGLHKKTFTYGEIDFISFAQLLEIAQLQPDECLVDLGSGAGKAVITTGLLYPHNKILGIELISALCELSIKQYEKCKALLSSRPCLLTQSDNIQFVNQDMLNVDFSHANVIFINATCYNDTFMQEIVNRLNRLAIGSRVIITTKKLTSDKFQCIDNQARLMSWGKCRCRVYLKVVP